MRSDATKRPAKFLPVQAQTRNSAPGAPHVHKVPLTNDLLAGSGLPLVSMTTTGTPSKGKLAGSARQHAGSVAASAVAVLLLLLLVSLAPKSEWR